MGYDLLPYAGGDLCKCSYIYTDLPLGPAFCKCGAAGWDDRAPVYYGHHMGECIPEGIRKDISAEENDPGMRGAAAFGLKEKINSRNDKYNICEMVNINQE